MSNSWQPCYLNSAHTSGGYVFSDAIVKLQYHVTERSTVELENIFVCSRGFQACAHLEKKVPETFYLSFCGLEKLELIMRLLRLDSRGGGMLPGLKVSTAD